MSITPLFATGFLTGGATILAVVGIVMVIFLSFAIWASRYTKVGPNQVLVISGRQYLYAKPDGTVQQRGFRIVKGGGTFVMPVIEKVDVLNLAPVIVEFEFDNAIAGAAQVKINSDDASIPKAAEHFLNKSPDQIRDTVIKIVESHCRKTEGSSPSAVIARIEEQVTRDLAAMGLSVLSFTIRRFDKTDSLKEVTGKPPVSAIT